jgi:hypothetical protein
MWSDPGGGGEFGLLAAVALGRAMVSMVNGMSQLIAGIASTTLDGGGI